MAWQLQEAKSKFSQLVNRAQREGPQIVTRHGEEVVVVVAVEHYRSLVGTRPTLLDLLLDSPLSGSNLVFERDASDFGRATSL